MVLLSLVGAEAIIFVGITLLLYDYVLTFKDEVQCIWQRGFSGVTVTFVLVRYGTILNFLLEGVYSAVNVDDPSTCAILNVANTIAQAATFSGLGLFCCLRVYAVSHRSILLSIIVAISMTINVVGQLYSSLAGAHAHVAPLPYHGCFETVSVSARRSDTIMCGLGARSFLSLLTQPNYTFLAYVGMGFGLFGELVVQLATWQRTFRIARSLKQLKMSPRLIVYLLRDGTFMFCFLLIWLLVSELTPQQELVPIDDYVISIVVCRFILRLRQVYLPTSSSEHWSTDPSPSRLTGNIGGPLEFNVEDGGDSDDEENEEVIIILDRPLKTSLEMP